MHKERTPFGEEARRLRVRNKQTMGEMAEAIGTSAQYLSAVENGKKNVPKSWAGRIADHYGLGPRERAQLEAAIGRSMASYKIDANGASRAKRRAAAAFAGAFPEMGDRMAEEITELIRKAREKSRRC